MNFLLTDEQLELRAAVRGFLADKSSEQAVRRLMATPDGYDPAVWRQMSDQLGLTGLAVPEDYEGAGFGYLELGILAGQARTSTTVKLDQVAGRLNHPAPDA